MTLESGCDETDGSDAAEHAGLGVSEWWAEIWYQLVYQPETGPCYFPEASQFTSTVTSTVHHVHTQGKQLFSWLIVKLDDNRTSSGRVVHVLQRF